jgi:4-aminobutyrate aminotransferase-like enzyme
MLKILNEIKERHKIVGDVRCIGCLGGIELVKDRNTKEPFEEAGIMVYKKAFQKGLAWVPAGHNLRLAPPIIITKEVAKKGLEIIEEAIYETEREFGY